MSDQSEEARASEGAERLRQENAELLARAAALDAEWEELHAANLEEYMRPFVLDDDRRMAYRAFYGAGFGEDLTAREHANRVLAKGQALAQRPVLSAKT